MFRYLPLLLPAALVGAVPTADRFPRQSASSKLLIGGPGYLTEAVFNGDSFELLTSQKDSIGNPSWLLYNEPHIYAVDEWSSTLNTLSLDAAANAISLQTSGQGSSGVVFLETNADQTHMIGPAYGSGKVDVWDISDPTSPVHDKALTAGPKGTSHPHQGLLDPSGDFFVVNDLGLNQLIVISTKTNEIINRVTIDTAVGEGLRHGAFYPPAWAADRASHYMVVTELSNDLLLFEVDYDSSPGELYFNLVQSLKSFNSQDTVPADDATPAAGELLLAPRNGNASCSGSVWDVYVTNRNLGLASDTVAHFEFTPSAASDKLAYRESVDTHGLSPRSLTLSADGSVLFVSNQKGETGLLAIARDVSAGGALNPEPLALVSNDVFTGGQEGLYGPEYAMQVEVAAAIAKHTNPYPSL